MIRCKPERNPRQAVIIIVCCAAAFIAVAAAACIIDGYKWLFELLLLTVTVAGVYVAYRFSITVYKNVGRKRTAACSLDLSTAVTLLPKNEFETKQKKRELPYINTRFNFNQNIKSPASYVYVCEFNGRNIAVEFEPNSIFVNAMLEEIENSKRGEGDGDI